MVARENFTELCVTLSSNEELGILDTSYIEDAFGVDGQLTLHNLDTGSDVAVLMNETTPHESFVGFYPFSALPDGRYEARGRVWDVVGNIRNFAQLFDITNAEISVSVGWLRVSGVYALSFPTIDMPAIKLRTQPPDDLRLPAMQQSLTLAPPQLSLVVPFPRG